MNSSPVSYLKLRLKWKSIETRKRKNGNKMYKMWSHVGLLYFYLFVDSAIKKKIGENTEAIFWFFKFSEERKLAEQKHLSHKKKKIRIFKFMWRAQRSLLAFDENTFKLQNSIILFFFFNVYFCLHLLRTTQFFV